MVIFYIKISWGIDTQTIKTNKFSMVAGYKMIMQKTVIFIYISNGQWETEFCTNSIIYNSTERIKYLRKSNKIQIKSVC